MKPITKKILVLDLVLVALIVGIFIGKAIPKPIQYKVVEVPRYTCENRELKQTLIHHFYEMGYDEVDSIYVVDANGDNWVVYYVCAGGDCYTVTLWHGEVDICEQLN